jgi:hypothetical protein
LTGVDKLRPVLTLTLPIPSFQSPQATPPPPFLRAGPYVRRIRWRHFQFPPPPPSHLLDADKTFSFKLDPRVAEKAVESRALGVAVAHRKRGILGLGAKVGGGCLVGLT